MNSAEICLGMETIGAFQGRIGSNLGTWTPALGSLGSNPRDKIE
ncbi:hypothetical protein TR2A62_3363 [Thalassobium sp. R2A62]|nr:hypothetical protein TR2A62_3363 [Thalassobium sp. R2A62]